jgi:hypothetical protein
MSAVEGGQEIDEYTFCNFLETPVKFTSGKQIVECNRHVEETLAWTSDEPEEFEN